MAHNDLILLGKRVCEVRSQKNFSQEKLAEIAGLSARHISELERGRVNPTYEVLKKLAEAMDIPIETLLRFQHHQGEADIRKELKTLIDELSEPQLRLAHRILNDIKM